MTSPGSRPGSPAYPQPTPVPGSSATRTSSAEPPSGAGPAQSTTIARAPGSPPQAIPVTDQPAGMGSGTQAGTRASAVTAEMASWATSTVWCSGVTAPCTWHHAWAVEPGRTTSGSPQRGQTGETLIAQHRPGMVANRQGRPTGGTRPDTPADERCVACRPWSPCRPRTPSHRSWHVSPPWCTTPPAGSCSSGAATTRTPGTGPCPAAGSRTARPSSRRYAGRSSRRPACSCAPAASSGGGAIPGAGVVYAVADLVCPPDPPDQQAVAGDDASDVVLADAATLDRLTCTPRLVETRRGWGVLAAGGRPALMRAVCA